MIRRLQRQFVAIAMISLLFIIVAIVGAINGFNLRQINSTADAILELLARNGGVFPDADSSGLVSSPDSDLVLTPETRFETRYFVVFIREDGEISGVLLIISPLPLLSRPVNMPSRCSIVVKPPDI